MNFYFDDGDIWYGFYQGSADLVFPGIVKKRNDCFQYRRRGTYKASQNCMELKHVLDHVLVLNTYGSEAFWHGCACRECGIFYGPCDPTETQTFDTELLARQRRTIGTSKALGGEREHG